MPAASIWHDATSWPVTALVLEEDTIPKPDGLEALLPTMGTEQQSIDLGRYSRKIKGCSITFEP